MEKRTCSEDSCDRPVRHRGLCYKHNELWRAANPPVPSPDLPGETWLPVVGYEGLYKVSDFGRVRSLPRKTIKGIKGGQLLKPRRATTGGYLMVTLSYLGVEDVAYVHRLVMEAFVGPCPEGEEVRHLDGNPANAARANLKYDDHATNLHDQRVHGTNHNLNKTHCPQDHPYVEGNIYWHKGRRNCRTCALTRAKAQQAKRRQERLAARALRQDDAA